MRLLPALAVLTLCAAACAGRPAVRPEGAIQRVVVIAASRAPTPPVGTISGQLIGESEPREVLAREGRAALEARGFRVLESVSTAALEPSVEQVKGLVAQTGAEAAVVLVLRRMDLSALRPLGQAEVEVETRLMDREGRVTWSASREVATAQRLYRAQSDWRSHLRQAVSEAVQEVP
jgi:hypothetical protein